jgi:hypothetical protein
MRFILTFIFGLILTGISAQHNHEHICGTTIEDQLLLEAKARLAGPSKYESAQRLDKIYIPIKFHIVTKGDGTGGVKHSAILDMLCKLNQDYEPWEMVFYPKDGTDYEILENSTAYNDPRGNENLFRNRKDDSAVNVFVTGDIQEPQGQVGNILGYYSPSNDLIVSMLNQFNLTSNTMSHEMGHFFTLRHTFFGWEGEPYAPSLHGNQVNFLNAPGTNIPVELVDRSNCDVAADRLCDTPPDYNFGIRSPQANPPGISNGCGLTAEVKDRNGDVIVPMANNQMSYFDNCPEFLFTNDQYDQMLKNYNSELRDFLKSTYVPNETLADGTPTITSPSSGDTYDEFNNVTIEWEAVDGADHYLIEIQNSSDYRAYYSNEPQITIYDLEPDINDYTAKVFAFNDGNTCNQPSQRVFFETGDNVSNTVDQNIFEDVTISPNPAQNNTFISIISNRSENIRLNIFDTTGKLMQSSELKISSGITHQRIDLSNFNSGIHIVQINSEKGKVSQKLSIIK